MTKRKFWDLLLLSVMLIGLCTLFLSNQRLRAALATEQNRSPVDVDQLLFEAQLGLRLPQLQLSYLESDTQVILPSEEPKGLTLLILMTPHDCPKCFLEVPFWNSIEQYTDGKIRVVGIIKGGKRRQCLRFAQGQELSIPIFFDSQGQLFQLLKIDDSGLTPLKVLLNERGIIQAFQRSSMGNKQKEANFLEYLKSQITN